MKEYKVPDNRFKGFYHFNELGSTMAEAEKFIEKGVRRGIVISDAQICGYGRNSKSWFSPDNGNLYCSFFEKMNPLKLLNLVPQRTALATLRTVKKFVSDGSVLIKWPNDILVDMKKSAGIIAKNVQKDSERFNICGIGINVFLPDCTQFDFNWKVGSIYEKNREITTEKVLVELIKAMDHFFDLEENYVADDFVLEISWMIGKTITYTQNGIDINSGTVTGFSHDGSMIKISSISEKMEISAASIINIL